MGRGFFSGGRVGNLLGGGFIDFRMGVMGFF